RIKEKSMVTEAEKYHDKLVRLMVDVTKKFKLGNPLDKNTDMGPLISEKQRERVERYIKSGIDDGTKLECGGKRPRGRIFNKGFFLEPTIFSKAEHHMKICQEEIFGPVISVFKYKKIDEAIEKANDVVYGLASSVYGCNIADCIKVANKLNFGTVWINEHGILTSEMPHGGFKQSGFGKDLSLYSFEEYTRLKHVYIDLTKLKRRSWHYTVYGKP
ncbi:MAG: aldehyde dehydrogenase family protein, partial [Nanoarchaeota archaeon]